MKSSIWFWGAGLTTLVAVWSGCTVGVSGGIGAGTTTHSTSSKSSSGTGNSTGHGGGTTTGTGGHPGSSSGSISSSSSGSSGTGGTAPTNPFECTIPATPPSTGSCVTTVAANDAGTGIECNPVTNGGCTGGAACDINTDTTGMNIIGFVCYDPPDTAAVCAMCDDMTGPTSCTGGTTCYPTGDANSDYVCAQYCCTDADCGTGKCATVDTTNTSLFGPVAPKLGLCVAM